MNEPLPDFADALGTAKKISGGWMVALSQALIHEGSIELGVASRVPGGHATKMLIGGIKHFSVPTSKKSNGLLRPTEEMIKRYDEIIEIFSPDVIHVHGTEWYAGIITAENRMKRPTIISIQGLIDHHVRHLTGHIEFMDLVKSQTIRNWFLFDGLWRQKAQWIKRAAVEREIIQGHQAFIGRTLWDRAHLRRLKPDAKYYHCHEMVRKVFYDREWSFTSANRHTIFAPSADYPLKGFHVLVKAIAILMQEFPDIKVRVPHSNFVVSNGIKGLYEKLRRSHYSNYLAGLIKRLGVAEHIIGLKSLTGEEMAEEMRCAHVFTLNSFVENSPNTMAEAFTLGVPSVVSLAGGIPSLIQDGRNALGYPPGDEALLAEQIRRIFLDDDLARRLSQAGREIARFRHSPESIVKQMLDIYKYARMDNSTHILQEPLSNMLGTAKDKIEDTPL